jgi:hypothetical protein
MASDKQATSARQHCNQHHVVHAPLGSMPGACRLWPCCEPHLVASLPAFKAERRGDDAHCEDAHLLGDGGNHRRSPTACASTHASLQAGAVLPEHVCMPATWDVAPEVGFSTTCGRSTCAPTAGRLQRCDIGPLTVTNTMSAPSITACRASLLSCAALCTPAVSC